MSVEDDVVNLNRQFKKDSDYWEPDRRRHIINQRMYWAMDHGQWPEEVITEMIEEQRQMPTINIIGDKIKGMIGLILKKPIRY